MGALLDDEQRVALVTKLAKDFVDAIDDVRREAERRLVDQHQLGPRHQRAGNDELLLLAPRELSAGCRQALAEEGKWSSTRSKSSATACRSFRMSEPIRMFSSTVSCEKTCRPSGTKEMPSRAICSGEAGNRFAGERDARHRLPRAGDGHHGGRLAGAVRTDDADELALADREADIADGGVRP